MLEAGGMEHKTWHGLEQFYRAKDEQWTPDRAHLGVREVTLESRVSMEEAWGYTPAEQIRMENSVLSLSSTTVSDWQVYLSHFAGDNRLAALSQVL
jgi:hypothetical protein